MAIYVRAIDGMSNHTAADLRGAVADLIEAEGVVDLAGGHLQVIENGTPNMSVLIDPGVAYVENDSWTEFSSVQRFWDVIVDAQVNLSISSNPSGSTRIDLVCLKVDTGVTPDANASNVASVVVVEGTAGAGSPALPNNHLELAAVTVASGATSITTANIADSRDQLVINQNVAGATSGTIVLRAAALAPTTTAGCSFHVTVEAGTNDVDYKVLDFDQSTEENCFIGFPMPAEWDGGTMTASFYWTAASGSGDVIWGIKGRSYANDEAIDQAYGTARTVTDTLIATGDIHVTSATGDITLAGTPAGGEWIQFKIYRDADAGGDTLSGDARLIAVTLTYGISI